MHPRVRRMGCAMGQVLRQCMSVHPNARTEVLVRVHAVSHSVEMKGVVVRSSKVK